MPQMYPMEWILLYLYFLYNFYFMLMMIYFLMKFVYIKKMNKNLFIFNWMW